MKRIRTYLSQVNTWTAIAILALTGWLLDSLFWYLETHPLTLAGFITFLGHSWYALLLLGAIFILLRLHRPSELLSLTIYDERGQPLHHQGNFRLEEAVLDPILASFQGATQTDGLHQLKLPAGPVICFFKQGALTLVACFSGPPPQRQLDEGLRLIAQQEVPGEDLLGDLPLDVAALAIKLLKAAVERELLVQLWTKRRTAMTAADWASQVGYDELEVTGALENLEGLALVQRQCAGDLTFYRLTNDEILLRRLEEFIAWRGDWLFRAHRVEELVGSGS